jgi:hypothetical protein
MKNAFYDANKAWKLGQLWDELKIESRDKDQEAITKNLFYTD